jgi:hypothetical protein
MISIILLVCTAFCTSNALLRSPSVQVRQGLGGRIRVPLAISLENRDFDNDEDVKSGQFQIGKSGNEPVPQFPSSNNTNFSPSTGLSDGDKVVFYTIVGLIVSVGAFFLVNQQIEPFVPKRDGNLPFSLKDVEQSYRMSRFV